MAKEKGKKSIGKIVVIAIVVLVAIGAFASMGGNDGPKVAGSSEEPTAQKEGKQEEPAAQKEGKQEEQGTENLAVGTAVDMGDGATVSVDSIETVSNYDGSALIKATVTYKNNSDDTISFNSLDWKGEDANGAQENVEYYVGADASTDKSALDSGNLAAGGTKTGTVYFKEGTVKILYSGNIFSKDVKASWTVA